MPQQKSSKIILYLFLFLVIGTFNNKNLNNINFGKINKIDVSGLDEKNNIELMSSLNVLKISNLFFFSELKVREILNANSLVEEYFVFKQYPSTLNIKINKTKFLAIVKKNGISFFLGSNGKFTKVTGNEINVPFIFGDFKKRNFYELKKAIDDSNFNYKEIKNLFFFQSGRWDIETNYGLLIKLPKDNLKDSLKLFTSFIAENYKKNINIIDLRQYNQIIINGK